jgi:DNA-binding response OmpR family regulator
MSLIVGEFSVYTVLLVDDDSDLLDMMVLLSQRSDAISLEPALSAKDAQVLLSQKPYDAIILDYEMPDLNGIEFLKSIRSTGDTTPVIIFTGNGSERIAIEALNYGADFFLKKEDDPRRQFREMADMVKRGAEQRHAGRAPGTMRMIISSMINFSSDASFAIDHEGKVIAWNDAMEHLTRIPAKTIIGQGEYAYAEPFFGKKKKMLVDLVFANDEEILQHNYMIVSRVVKGPVIAVTTGMKPDKQPWTIWMKAMPVYDSSGNFIGAVGSIRDITSTIGDVPLDKKLPEDSGQVTSEGEKPAGDESGVFDRFLGKAAAHYRKGVNYYSKDLKYKEAIAAFDEALKFDNKLSHAWNDRGLCFRALADHSEALKSFLRAVELEPENTEFLYALGEQLEIIGVLYMSNKYLDSAIKTFQMVINQMPNCADGWNHIGICMKEAGRTDESKFYFDRARDIRMWKKDTPVISKREKYL